MLLIAAWKIKWILIKRSFKSFIVGELKQNI